MKFCHCCWTFYDSSCIGLVPFMKERGKANSDVYRSEEVHIPFSRWREKFPCGLLAVWQASEQKCELASRAHKQTEMLHIHGSLIVVALLLPWTVNVHNELAKHFSSHLILSTPPIFFFSTHPLCLCLWLALSLALFILLSLSLPRTRSSLLSSISPPPLPVVLVCALVCHEEGGGWLVVGGLDRHLILALPHNVGMCNLFKIRFPRWVLSTAMVSTIMRVCTVGLLSLPHSLCLSYGCLWHFCTWIYSSFHSCLAGAAIAPKACKPL